MLSADEVNFLVFRYLQESGFVHTAFSFSHECLIARNRQLSKVQLPPGALISFIQKGLQLARIEAHLDEDGRERRCQAPFSLLAPHVCTPAPEGAQVVNFQSVSQAESILTAAAGEAPVFAQNGLTDSTIAKLATSSSSPTAAEATTADAAAAFSGDVVMDGPVLPSTTPSTASQSLLACKGHGKDVLVCSWHPSLPLLATGSDDGTVRLWQLEPSTNAISSTIVLEHFADARDIVGVSSLEWHPSGQLLATGTRSGAVRVWDVSGKSVGSEKLHTAAVMSVRWSPSGSSLLSAGLDGLVVLYPNSALTSTVSSKVHATHALSAVWLSETRFATASNDATIALCDVLTSPAVDGSDSPAKPSISLCRSLTAHTKDVNVLAWSQATQLLASGSDDGVTIVWNVDGSLLARLEGHTGAVNAVQWSPAIGAKSLASASVDGSVRLWDVSTGQCLASYQRAGSQAPVHSLAFHPSGTVIACGSGDTLCSWAVSTSALLKSVVVPGEVFDVSWHSDGLRIAAVSGDSAYILDGRT